ncbi:hypothetical protein WICANDRAFT_33914 [Wickerhamomyces anomalus NRRL Y-366-8]|uniref:mRNA-capping enzyme subunit beta n=1 Tax=Wickerhamomyces anomalus (strain ATCC 58044 / CBS 1984 / NCYC 433 / NRRL Y-366-8) TaxID=683960 RepID=A0A1E3NYS4_WICAA|nr:uncharacterized protein WICANDRAFT_33914 [Wickerhamomyces anomalus NRRL Y-366-8]ODQ58283.1 hypothetical protein WICANDRAFT_33914 [Wickerhamomyces anomalus NRRL Y-366-8]
MDLKSLLGPSADSRKEVKEEPQLQVQQTPQQQQPQTHDRPELKHRYSSITSLMNNDDDPPHSSSPSSNIHLMNSPAVAAKYQQAGSNPVTPGNKPIDLIRARNSITSLTNDTDVDIDGKETPKAPQQQSNGKRHSKIDSELGKLESLEKNQKENGKKGKPKRYSKPPIWAQKWVPNFKEDSHVNHSSSRFQRSDDAPKSHAVSITGVKPYNDITRRITNWIYAQIHSTPKELRQYLELETKFGRIWDKETDRRLHIPVTTESILDDGYALNMTFKAGLDKDRYEKLKKFLVGLTKINKDKFKTVKFDHIDRQYREAQRDKMPKFYRLTTDKSTGRPVQNIEKRKLASLFIHNPDMVFDFRLTMSIELPSQENPERFQDVTPEIQRHKRRTSIFHDLTATRFDITDVLQSGKGKNSHEFESLEVELEVDMIKLIDAYEKLDVDSFTFEELSETFMDNARILNRELLKPGK